MTFKTIKETTDTLIRQTLEACDGSTRAAAEALGCSQRKVQIWIRKQQKCTATS